MRILVKINWQDNSKRKNIIIYRKLQGKHRILLDDST